MTRHVGRFAMAICSLVALRAASEQVKASAEYPEFYNGDSAKGIDFVQSVKVLAPRYCSNVRGDTAIVFEAAGMTHAVAKCWRQPKSGGGWGEDAVLFDGELGPGARGEFVFKADAFPNGPLTVRIQAMDRSGRQDYCELQLYNLGGVKWRQGLPKKDPPGAKGMKLVFADDFDGPLSISSDGRGARYAAHKTGGGDFSGWPFSDPKGDCRPFGQKGTFLRIHASKPEGTKGCTGIISSLRSDGTGVAVPAPSYFECRLICHSAPGSWGAFWTLSKGVIGMSEDDADFERVKSAGCDELDVIECYGGYGPRNPNHGGKYGVTSHWWGQPGMGDAPHAFPDAMQMAGKSSWSWTFHTYGLAITETDTVYYFDDEEVLRHPTGPVSKSQETWFLINYAISGISGWPYDLERYGNESDMWVDWIRVYCGKDLPKDFHESRALGVKGSIGVNFADGGNPATEMLADDVAGAKGTAQANWNNVEGLSRKIRGLRDSDGNPTPVRIAVEKSARLEPCEPWGFSGADERLHRGGVADTRVAVKGVPFRKWNLVVHLGSGVNGWSGDVALLRPSGAEVESRAVNFGWIGGGRYVEAKRAKGTDSDAADCMVVFRGLDAPSYAISVAKRGGKGVPSIAGIQVVPAGPVR